MIHTWLFHYARSADDFGEITFCAEFVEEAIMLFCQYCKEDLKLDHPLEITSIEEIYDPDDAAYYGSDYASQIE